MVSLLHSLGLSLISRKIESSLRTKQQLLLGYVSCASPVGQNAYSWCLLMLVEETGTGKQETVSSFFRPLPDMELIFRPVLRW